MFCGSDVGRKRGGGAWVGVKVEAGAGVKVGAGAGVKIEAEAVAGAEAVGKGRT